MRLVSRWQTDASKSGPLNHWRSRGSLMRIPRSSHSRWGKVSTGERVLALWSMAALLAMLLGPFVATPAQAADSWSSAASMAGPREYHTATLLQNGQVLVVGGFGPHDGGIGWLASAELYNPTTNTWSSAGTMAVPRQGHTATLLPNGKVLVVGGYGGTGAAGSCLASAELYNPTTNTWSSAGDMATPREHHTATLLQNGRVLVAGGENLNGQLAWAELYDPANLTDHWSSAASLAVLRSSHAATLLQNGTVLVTGGFNGVGGYLASTERYTSNTWSSGGFMATGREMHTATLLQDGKVVVAGGLKSMGSYVASAERYNPTTNTWSSAGNMATARDHHTANLLQNGKVLVAGGEIDWTTHLASAELYNPSTNNWTITTNMAAARQDHTATLLQNGTVLVTGGLGNNGALASAELYTPEGGQSSHVLIDAAGYVTNAGLAQVPMLSSPQRLVDTRTSGGPIGAGQSRCFQIAGLGGIPSNAGAVIVNVTAVGHSGNGWLTVFPAGQAVPATSTVNFDSDEYAIANNAIVRVGGSGQVCVAAGNAASHAILDATGYVTSAGLTTVPMLSSPQRLVDTRTSGGPIGAGQSRCFQIAGLSGIPSTAGAVIVNVTAVGFPSDGWLTLFPAGQGVPATSTVNFDNSQYAIANGAVVKLGSGGQVCVNSGLAASHIVLDATGYITGAGLTTVPMLSSPQRLVDTRTSGGPIGAGQSRCFQIAGLSGIPSTAGAVIVNVTGVGYSRNGWLTLFQNGLPVPQTSTVNFDTDEYAIANGAVVKVGSGGQVCVNAGMPD